MMFPIRWIPAKTAFDFMGVKWIAFGLSLSLSIFAIGLMLVKGFNYGIDFSGGVVMEMRTEKPVELSKIRDLLDHAPFLSSVSLQDVGSPNDIMLRFQPKLAANQSQQVVIDHVKEMLNTAISPSPEYRKVDYVGPQVGKELKTDAAIALILAVIGIMIYIWMRFEWQYGVGAILALVHDAILTMGLFSLFNLEFNLTSIAAILTILGYSINDSVVIYDRIRENLRKYKKMPLEELLNLSINETLSRTILTVTTTLLAILSLILWGGPVIRDFSLSLFFGIFVGTYSSIYISAPILIFMKLRSQPATVG
jgi:preprotein translocase SecF subunit